MHGNLEQVVKLKKVRDDIAIFYAMDPKRYDSIFYIFCRKSSVESFNRRQLILIS
jgi:hypothetical protein